MENTVLIQCMNKLCHGGTLSPHVVFQITAVDLAANEYKKERKQNVNALTSVNLQTQPMNCTKRSSGRTTGLQIIQMVCIFYT